MTALSITNEMEMSVKYLNFVEVEGFEPSSRDNSAMCLL